MVAAGLGRLAQIAGADVSGDTEPVDALTGVGAAGLEPGAETGVVGVLVDHFVSVGAEHGELIAGSPRAAQPVGRPRTLCDDCGAGA